MLAKITLAGLFLALTILIGQNATVHADNSAAVAQDIRLLTRGYLSDGIEASSPGYVDLGTPDDLSPSRAGGIEACEVVERTNDRYEISIRCPVTPSMGEESLADAFIVKRGADGKLELLEMADSGRKRPPPPITR